MNNPPKAKAKAKTPPIKGIRKASRMSGRMGECDVDRSYFEWVTTHPTRAANREAGKRRKGSR